MATTVAVQRLLAALTLSASGRFLSASRSTRTPGQEKGELVALFGGERRRGVYGLPDVVGKSRGADLGIETVGLVRVAQPDGDALAGSEHPTLWGENPGNDRGHGEPLSSSRMPKR